MKPLNIAIAVPLFPNLVQTYVLNQLISLESAGMNVSIIASRKGPSTGLPDFIYNHKLLDKVIYTDVDNTTSIIKNLLRLPITKTYYRNAVLKLVTHLSRNKRHSLLKSIIRAKAICNGHYDIIHSHSLFTSFDLLFMKEVFSIPIVTTYHGQLPDGITALSDWKTRILFQQGDAFLVNTTFAKNELEKLGCPEPKIHIIPQGTKTDDFKFNSREIDTGKPIKLISIGRLSPEKGHHVALHAIRQLTNKYPLLEYHIVGEGPEKNSLVGLCKGLAISEHVFFHGFKAGQELNSLLADMHILILPSMKETQGVVLQEAQSCGIPVIANKTGGIPEVIDDNVTGLLYDENNHESLAGKIQQLTTDDELYQRLSKEGHTDVISRFDINIVSKKLLSLYDEIISSH